MAEFEYKITDEVGIHARPAGLLVKEAKQYEGSVTVACKGKSADATKLMMLMSLGVKQGDVVRVTVEGTDDTAAAKKLKTFFEENL